jgi:hypothetical protein
MTIEQKQKYDALNESLVLLQNKCNRAQGALIKAEQAEDGETIDRLLKEASLELE